MRLDGVLKFVSGNCVARENVEMMMHSHFNTWDESTMPLDDRALASHCVSSSSSSPIHRHISIYV